MRKADARMCDYCDFSSDFDHLPTYQTSILLKYKIGILVCLLASAVSLAAKEKTVKTVIRTWQLPSPTAIADTVQFTDTAYLNYPMRGVLNDYSISSAYNGNCLVSPIQSRLYFDRQYKIDDIFASVYQPYIYTPQDVRFFNTTTPYSSIAYNKGFTTMHEENEIYFLFTGNLNRRIKIGRAHV